VVETAMEVEEEEEGEETTALIESKNFLQVY
jgi:hypothetical protein